MGSSAGCEAHHPGNGGPSSVAAACPHHSSPSAWCPRARLRRPQTLSRLILETDIGAQVRRGAFTRGHTSAFHTSMAASSRSMARWTGTRADQPCRRSSFHTPWTGYPMRNIRPINVLTRASVQPWPSSQPWASGPRPGSRSRRSHCSGEIRSVDIGPLDRSAASPPSRQARRHFSTCRLPTRNPAAMPALVSPRSNRAPASNRTRSRASYSFGVNPPPCAYLIQTAYRNDHERHYLPPSRVQCQ